MPIRGVARFERRLELHPVVHLDQHGEAERVRDPLQLAHHRGRERRGDEQNAVRTHGAGLVHLIRLDHEILAQHRKIAGVARRPQMFGGALEELPVGQHGEAGGAVGGIARRDGGRFERVAQEPLARARALDLRDDGRIAGRDLRAHRADEIAHGWRLLGLGANRGERRVRFGRRDFLGLDGENALEDVAHEPRLRSRVAD